MTSHRIKNLAIAALCTVLAASVGLNILLSDRSRSYYLDLNQTRLDPLGVVGYGTDPAGEVDVATGGTKVVFFGDSRARDWTPPENMPGFYFINRGVGAQTSEQVLARFDLHAAPLKPDILILQVGINDLKTIPLFPEQEHAIVERCKDNIQTIVKKSKELGATVILTTVFPAGKVPLERRLFWSSDVDRAIESVNTFIKSLEDPGVIVLDSSFLADDKGVVKNEYSRDTLHLNASGYDALNLRLQAILESLGK